MDVKLQGDRGQPREAHRTLKTISRVGGGALTYLYIIEGFPEEVTSNLGASG